MRMQRLVSHSNIYFQQIPHAATTSHPRANWGGRNGAYCHNSEAVPRMHPRSHLPHGDGKCKDVGLERHAEILRIRRFATAQVAARDPGVTWSCSGDMKAGVPLKPVFDTVSTRFSTRATPADRFVPLTPRLTGRARVQLRTKVADARFKVTSHLFEQNIQPLDVAMNDLPRNMPP